MHQVEPMTNDRLRVRRDFLRMDPVVRARHIAEALSEITDMIVDNSPASEILERIDACAWMIEWAVPLEEPAYQAQLVGLQSRLSGLRRELTGFSGFSED